MCSDQKKNLYIERNRQLLVMAQEDMQLFKKLCERIMSNGSDNLVRFDVNPEGNVQYQRFTRADVNTLDY